MTDIMPTNASVNDLVRRRFSCRSYQKVSIAAEQANLLDKFIALQKAGPFDTALRFELALAMPHAPEALRGLGTYGLIRNPAGFIVGAVGRGQKNLEEFGFTLETIILYTTSIGLDTCWLGGNFTKTSFANRIRAASDEVVPAVAAIGYAAGQIRTQDPLRQKVRSDLRRPWNELFFQNDFNTPLPAENAGRYAEALELVRLAPSGHNYQPWRILQDGAGYHFYLKRTPGYGPGSLMFRLLGVADLQRIEIGIAMCHFELAARENGLSGRWVVSDQLTQPPDGALEYIVTWQAI